jgi:hypothetical protein
MLCPLYPSILRCNHPRFRCLFSRRGGRPEGVCQGEDPSWDPRACRRPHPFTGCYLRPFIP